MCSRFLSACSVVVLVALVATGCTRAHAKTMPQLPDAALDVPPAPERDIEPAEVEAPPPPQPPAPAPESPRTQPPRPRPAPAREQPRTEPPKPEPAPTPPAEAPKPAEEPPRGSPTSTLQTTPATVEGELERSVRATLAHATNELNRIDYRVLNADAKIQYDTAKRFIRQAEDAVKTKNLVFAKSLADKAATIADQLAGR
jgi:outer membrane biosynthesis protein TonB